MTLDELGAKASEHDTDMARAMIAAVVTALVEGSEYGFERA